MAKFYTSKYGTKINIEGLDEATIKKVKELADSKYGDKATALADKARSKTTKAPAPSGPGASQQTTFTPPEQAQTTTNAGGIANTVASSVLENVPNEKYDPNTVNQQYGIPVVDQNYINQYQDNAYNSLTRGLEDAYGRDRQALEQDLANRGIPIGSQAYNAQLTQLDRRYDEQRLAARSQSFAGGLDAANTYFGMGNTAHQTALGDYQSRWTLPTTIASSLSGIGQNATQINDAREASRKSLANSLAIAKLGYGGRGKTSGGGGSGDEGLNFV